MKCHLKQNGRLVNALLSEDLLHLQTCYNFHNVLSLQETTPCVLHHLHLNFFCNIFIINDCPLLSVQLVKREVSPPQEVHHPLVDASCTVHSTTLCCHHKI